MVDIINIYDASTTAANNLAVAGISDAEGWLPSTVNNFTRASWAVIAKFIDDYGGVITVAGTGNAVTLTSAATYTALSAGMRVLGKISATNTTAATLNLDAIGAKTIRKMVGGVDVALEAGDQQQGMWAEWRYDTAANGAAGGWILLNPAVRVKGFINGLNISNNSVDPDKDMDIAAGSATDVNNYSLMTLASAITKQVDAVWSVGSAAGGRDLATDYPSSSGVHIHLIKRPDTGVVDAIYSLSHDEAMTATMTLATPAVVTMGVAGNGHGLVARSPFKFSTTGALPTGVTAGTQYYVIATGLTETTFQFSASDSGAAINTSGSQSGVHTCLPGPVMPTNYTEFRRIGSRRTNPSTNFFVVVQTGDECLFSVPIQDISAANPGTAAVTRTLTLPEGIRVDAILGAGLVAGTNNSTLLLTAMTQADSAATSLWQMIALAAGRGATQARIRTDRSKAIRSRVSDSTAGTSVIIVTHGWIDTRGR